ncbi:nucleotidyltransferase domain-containing protein [Massilia aurea]|jgi:predicted nucleotidyltransferase|uniref:nucleotidyltransferase domain-containing protein n=1 Tax=Massilia aurea TaxID=373040 RepID=UPI00216255BF|nr:nucleotidyltransferase domain-containing protein [Massilia aurea]MCS0707551.1 nucleotidyltransferase domain-containing protein [Massilia aurea]
MGTYAEALFTKTQQRVLAVLFGQPHRSFYANEIIELAQSGSGAVQRELARLQASHLVTVQKIGNQKHYQANPDAPIYEELRGIVMKTFGVADVLRNALIPLWPLIEVAFIYGSLAKGTEHAGSDVDLMVIGSLPSNVQLLELLLPTHALLGRVVNPTLYTAAEFSQRVQVGKSFIIRVLEQPKVFVKGNEHDISRIGSAGEPGPDRQVEGRAA